MTDRQPAGPQPTVRPSTDIPFGRPVAILIKLASPQFLPPHPLTHYGRQPDRPRDRPAGPILPVNVGEPTGDLSLTPDQGRGRRSRRASRRARDRASRAPS